MAMYLLKDGDGLPMGVFDTPEEAKALVPEVDLWKPADKPGDWDGWRADYSYYDDKPHFTVRVVSEEV